MTPDKIAYLALIGSIVSLVVSFLTLYRDRHVVSVKAVPIGNADGTFCLSVTVMNSGKRAISINHVIIRPKDQPSLFVNFAPTGSNRIDVGESRSCQLQSSNLPVTWSSSKELRSFDILVQDAIGTNHLAIWEGTGKIKALTSQLTSRLRRWTR